MTLTRGVEKTSFAQLPKPIISHHGFQGCLASFELSGQSVDLITDAIVSSSLVETGCFEYDSLHSTRKCHHEICSNRGRCIQRPDTFMCDCDMTTFRGPTCNDEAIAYEFSSGKGIISYILPNGHKSKPTRDMIAVGFMTSINDAVLLRIESSRSNGYLEIEIVRNNLNNIFHVVDYIYSFEYSFVD
ncbi:hypothetical protein KQX54_015275 [Cotesia glomerata]|uniref:Uncharacterized protein n=1 Tax=Cotesia glomerata TaxID=32391 RepID=A0AAV7J7Q5_COTGL|nr:hypothetical protein KQX54_015275 [Cotesia glomerata]